MLNVNVLSIQIVKHQGSSVTITASNLHLTVL